MMDTTAPLRQPPTVVQLGLNVHGRLPIERFRLPNLWGIHLYHYSGSVTVAGTRCAFSVGDLSVTPPDTDLHWRFPAHAPHHYALVAWPHHAAADLVRLPIISQLGGRAASLAVGEAFDSAIAAFSSEPVRTTAWLWELLWRLAPAARPAARTLRAAGVPGIAGSAGSTGSLDTAVHPALQTCLRLIDLELDRPLGLNGLALRTGVSANQLLRIFHQQVGMTVMAYIRQRRAERARHLLEHSSLPLVDIAAAVGVGSYQRLNKLVRTAYGRPPRSFRDLGDS